MCMVLFRGLEKRNQKKLKMFNRPICLLTGMKLLLQDNLKLRTFDQSICLVIRIRLLMKMMTVMLMFLAAAVILLETEDV